MAIKKKTSKHPALSPSPSKVYYPFLDGFRGIAIIMILLHHMRRGFTLDYLFVSDPPILKWIYFKAWESCGIDLTNFYKCIQFIISRLKGILGVEIFLVISGFLIARILIQKHITAQSVIRFYQRRVFRIYPSYALMVILSLMVYVWQTNADLLTVIAHGLSHLLLLQNYFVLNPLLAHTWTLVVLEQFYFFCPLIILGLTRMIPNEVKRCKTMIGVCLASMVTGLLVRVYCLQSGQPAISWPLKSATPYWTTLYHLGPLSFGCLLALLEPKWSAWKKNKIWGLGLWGVGVMIFYHLFFIIDWSYYWGDWYLYSVGYLSVGMLIFAAYHGVSVLSRWKALQWVGRHAYGIFIWHYLVLEFWKLWCGVIPPCIIIVGCFVMSIAIGVVNSVVIEQFFLSIRDRRVPSI